MYLVWRGLLATLVVVCYVTSHGTTASEECTQVDRCSCKFSNGSVIDISPLGRTDGYPRYDWFHSNVCVEVTQKSRFLFAFQECAFARRRQCDQLMAIVAVM